MRSILSKRNVLRRRRSKKKIVSFKKNLVKEAESVKHIFNEAWSENWGNVPFNDTQWHHLIKDLKMILNKKSC